ncbi:hypothetical protein MUN81_08300 [Hymenobacter sp. 5317J-9]|uniref:hypothetical protein n=1 Tax=Hymenobacter sp. 5317J-9 TaxID=2932250 RepID=UPI001FD6E238|nr:hypothetical protein [Hymenobacter sp. 5317J-9]UOQ99478.1 hypothetical protein MUN81_08300 [Hymenobacter sp. 5317J-9]
MKQGNRISETLSTADAKKIVDLLRQVQDLMPFLITLQPEESRGLRNIGFDGVPFAQAALDAVRADPGFTRRSFDLAEFEKDVALMDGLRGIQAVLGPLAQKVSDTYRLAGADVMVTADDVYEDLRQPPERRQSRQSGPRHGLAPPPTGSGPLPGAAEPVPGG